MMEMTQRAAAERAFLLAQNADAESYRLAQNADMSSPSIERLIALATMWCAVAAQFVWESPAEPKPQLPVADDDGNCLTCGHPLYTAVDGLPMHIGGNRYCVLNAPGQTSG